MLKCKICALWRIDRPASHVGHWDNGKSLLLCEYCVASGAGRGLGKAPRELTAEELGGPVVVDAARRPEIAITIRPITIGERYGSEVYSMPGASQVKAHFRSINGTLYRFTRVEWLTGKVTVTAWKAGKVRPIHTIDVTP